MRAVTALLARVPDTYSGLRAAQALVGGATALRDALVLMHERGGSRIHTGRWSGPCASSTASDGL
jgi:hypothetical protein